MSVIGNGVGSCRDCGAPIHPPGSARSGCCSRCDAEPPEHDVDAALDDECLCRACLDALEEA